MNGHNHLIRDWREILKIISILEHEDGDFGNHSISAIQTYKYSSKKLIPVQMDIIYVRNPIGTALFSDISKDTVYYKI